MRFWLRNVSNAQNCNYTNLTIDRRRSLSSLLVVRRVSSSNQWTTTQLSRANKVSKANRSRGVDKFNGFPCKQRQSIRKQNKLRGEGENELLVLFFSVFAIMRQMLSQYCLPYYGIPPSPLAKQHLKLIFDKISPAALCCLFKEDERRRAAEFNGMLRSRSSGWARGRVLNADQTHLDSLLLEVNFYC
jgi:hypothetical protein